MSISTGPLLAIDSSSPTGSVALGGGGTVEAEIALRVNAGHSAALLPAVDYALRSAGRKPADLRGVVLGAGPGSFTGLRIAAASAKGIVKSLDIPLLAYSSLMAAASQAWSFEGVVCALFDARGRDVYAACYRWRPRVETLAAPAALPLDKFLRQLPAGADLLFVGDGAAKHRAELESAWPGSVAPSEFEAPRAAGLLWLANRIPEVGHLEQPSTWQPDYLRQSGAERIAAERASGKEDT